MTCCFGFVNKRVYKSPIYYDLVTLADDHDVFGCSIILFLFTKPKQHVIEIIYGRGKFVGDFNMGTL